MAAEEVKVVQTLPTESEVGQLVKQFNALVDALSGVSETGTAVDAAVKKIKLVQ